MIAVLFNIVQQDDDTSGQSIVEGNPSFDVILEMVSH